MKTKIKKVFMDIAEEEKWLNQQGENGLMLLEYNNGEYVFENVAPAKYQYKIDLPKALGKKKKEYFSFLEECGISVVAEYGGRVYLRKNNADGPLEIYTENKEIKQQMSKRYAHFYSIGFSQFAFGAFLLIQPLSDTPPQGAAFWICIVFGIGFIISGGIFTFLGIKKHRKHMSEKEDMHIWE